eukprot:TRINITY_DN33348_c0_g1_i1.p1 TRINITY_DN33348_c0_g1~~TRINITY_DN33348_c0_g1_i1.p1  ORF type:complete len:491 (+),score=162.86 TRINITY_DN33348_c0_g1_i1:50-1474(+)
MPPSPARGRGRARGSPGSAQRSPGHARGSLGSTSAKKAKTGSESYYRTIDGVKYDRALLEKAESFAEDGQVSFAEAKDLWESAQDGKEVTAVEKETLEYTMVNFSYSAKAKRFLQAQLGSTPTSSYYRTVGGVKYDRELLEKAEQFAKDGQISHAEAEDLWKEAQDGKGVTDCEVRTLQHVLDTLKFTDKAKKFLESQLNPGVEATPKKMAKSPDTALPPVVAQSPAASPAFDRHSAEAAKAEAEQAAQEVKDSEEAIAKFAAAELSATQEVEAADAAAAQAKALEVEVQRLTQSSERAKLAAERAKTAADAARAAAERAASEQASLEHAIKAKNMEINKAREKAASKASATALAEEAKTQREEAERAIAEKKRAAQAAADKAASLTPQRRVTGKSYYKVIGGVRYDRELLEMAEAATKSAGKVSLEEAQQLFHSALDGKGITATEKMTLEYCLQTFKFTDKASKFLVDKLANL